MTEQYRLERWTGREYVPHGLNLRPPDELADCARMLGLPAWRVVRADKDRPARAPRWRPSKPGSGRSIERVRADYFEWAEARGLESVTVYRDDRRPWSLSSFRKWIGGGASRRVVEVDPAEFIGPAPAAEIITEGDE